MSFRASAPFALAFIYATSTCAAYAAPACSNDTFAIERTSLSIEICEAAAHPSEGALTETLTVAGRPPLVRSVTYPRAGGATSRTIDDIPLGSLGVGKTLHVTIAVRAGNVRLEHALLVPGAIPLK